MLVDFGIRTKIPRSLVTKVIFDIPFWGYGYILPRLAVFMSHAMKSLLVSNHALDTAGCLKPSREYHISVMLTYGRTWVRHIAQI